MMTEFVFYVMAGMFVGLFTINMVIVVARLLHKDDVAASVSRRASKLTWVFRLGDGDHAKRRHGRDERLRA